MRYCFHCGKELPEGSSFCPYCGQSTEVYQQPPVEAEPQKPKVKVSTRVKSIVSIALGGEALSLCPSCFMMLLYDFIFSVVYKANAFDSEIFYAMSFTFVFLVSIMTMAFSIAGKILAMKALGEYPGYKPAKIGNTLSTVGIILCAVVIVLSFLIKAALTA